MIQSDKTSERSSVSGEAPTVEVGETEETEALLPCPFCFGPADITSTVGGEEGDGYIWHVFCAEENDCAMMPDMYTESERTARQWWNLRNPSPEIAALIAERDALKTILTDVDMEWGQPHEFEKSIGLACADADPKYGCDQCRLIVRYRAALASPEDSTSA